MVITNSTGIGPRLSDKQFRANIQYTTQTSTLTSAGIPQADGHLRAEEARRFFISVIIREPLFQRGVLMQARLNKLFLVKHKFKQQNIDLYKFEQDSQSFLL